MDGGEGGTVIEIERLGSRRHDHKGDVITRRSRRRCVKAKASSSMGYEFI